MSDLKIKYGKTTSGIQRFKDQETNRYYQEKRKHQHTINFKLNCVFLYYNSLTYRRIGTIYGISHVTVYNWVREYSSMIVEKCNLSDVTQIADLEIDELYTFCDKKENKIYVMTAVDAASYQMVKFDVVEDKTEETFVEFLDKIVEDDSIQVSDYHTDAAQNYKSYFKQKRKEGELLSHTTTKDKTTQVESFNSIMRGTLSSLVRRGKCITHSVSNLYRNLHTIFFLYNKKIKNFIDFLKFSCTFVQEIDLTGCIYFNKQHQI